MGRRNVAEAEQVRDLLNRGTVAAQLGRLEEAERLFNQVVALDPENVDAWLGLAGVVTDPEEKKRIYQTVLALEPDHPVAREGLRQLQTSTPAAPFQPAPKAPPPAEAAPSPEERAEAGWRVLRHEDGVPIYACTNHLDRETTLRCNRCGKPICTECAVLTDVGYRCRECVRELEGRFYRAGTHNVALALVAAGVLGLLSGVAAAMVGGFLGFWSIFVAPAVAGLVAEGIWRAGGRQRARNLNLYAALVVAAAGGLVLLLPVLALGRLVFNPFALLILGFTVITVYGRLR